MEYRCFVCGGDGKETCTNPDHGFISAISFHDVGRCGCPVCGHDPQHKVKNGGACDCCNGSGKLSSIEFNEKSIEYCLDDSPDDYEISPIFEMDGSEHYQDGSCCLELKACKCGGSLHYQPVYGSYYYKCDKCLLEF